VPYTPVLLSLTEKDCLKYNLANTYALIAMTQGLLLLPETMEYASKNFNDIGHPDIKLFCAGILFYVTTPTQDVVFFLQGILKTEEGKKRVALMVGPQYESFLKNVMDYKEKK
jgi:hypothetical protein